MSRLLVATLAAGLALSAGVAVAAPAAKLKQFRVPTADSSPRAITNGSDGNRWFTEGTEFTAAPAKIARITPAGVVTEFKAVKGSDPFGITVAPNGDPWYTMMATNKIATLQLQ
jgi:streptogramin lyase